MPQPAAGGPQRRQLCSANGSPPAAVRRYRVDAVAAAHRSPCRDASDAPTRGYRRGMAHFNAFICLPHSRQLEDGGGGDGKARGYLRHFPATPVRLPGPPWHG